MPPKLYFYINFATIKRNKPGSKVKSFGRPSLRDIEWKTFQLVTEARGFSGFELDDQYTCSLLAKEYLDNGLLPDNDLIDNAPNAINREGNIKEYIPAREYLDMIHPYNKGLALYENQAKNLFILGSRGWGKSYSVGGIVAQEYLFDGQTIHDPLQEISAAEIVVGAGDSKYSAETLEKVRIIISKLPGAYEGLDGFTPAPFFKRYTGSFQPGKEIINKYDKKIGGTLVKKGGGTGSNIKHRTFKDDPFAANGTRPGIMIFEEVGMFNNLKESYGASVECQRDSSYKFGSMFFIGTGGDMEGGTLDAHEMFYNPVQYDCLTFEDD